MLSPFRWFALLKAALIATCTHQRRRRWCGHGGGGCGGDGEALVRILVTGWGGIGAPASGMDVLRNVSLGLSLKYPRYPITTKFESPTARH